MNVNEHIAIGHAKYKAHLIKSGYPKHLLYDASLLARDYVECKSGLQFSAQASVSHYCTPRRNDGPWTRVEIGYPNRHVQDFGEPGEDVYGYIPIEIVDAVIAANGGFVDD